MRKESHLQYWQQITTDLANEVSSANIQVTEDQVWKAIQIYCSEQFPDEIEFWTDIFFLYVEYPVLLKYLSNYDFQLNDIEFDTTTADVHYSLVYMVKAEVKHKGLIWTVHKNDADPFPSTPHAHDVINGFKLHLGTGTLYKKRDPIGKLSKKEFYQVREKLEQKGIVLPPLEA